MNTKDIKNDVKNIEEEKNEIILNTMLEKTLKNDFFQYDSKRHNSPINLTNDDKKKNDEMSLSHDLNKKGSEKKEKIFLSQRSFNTMNNQENNHIVLQVPKDVAQSLQISHQIDLLAHEDFNKKIEGIEYKVKQICDEKFKTSDELIKFRDDERRAHNHTRILFLSCIACGALCIVISVTGIVLGIHFIPLK